MLDENGNMCGSLIVMDVDDLAAAQAFNAADPYQTSGVFTRVEISRVGAPVAQG